MADGTVVMKHVPANPCCELWKEKLSKLQQKFNKSENYRTAFKLGIGNYEKQIAMIEAENLELKKVHEEERMRAANEREEKFKESAMRVSLENEIFALKSEIFSLKQKVSSGAEDVGEEVVHLRACVAEGEKEINQLKEHLEKEQMRADSETKKVKAELKKADAELKKANEAWKTAKVEKARDEKLQEDNEKEMKVKESAFRVSLENEISALKSQITLLQQQAKDMEEKVTLLQARVCEREAEIYRLKELLQKEKKRADSVKKKSEEERKKADAEIRRAEKLQAENEREEKAKGQAMRVALENEISDLKSQILVLQQKAGSDAQNVDNDEPLLKACVSEKETEINRLKEILEKEKTRADFEKKKADEEKKKANEISDKLKAEKSRAEKVLADNEKEEKAKEMAMKLSLENEISALRSQILVLQQGIGVRDVDKEVSLLQELVSKGEAEINQLRGLLEKERTRAEFEKKKFETEKEKANEAQKTLKAEKSRADEERKLAAVEGKKAEEARHQLERLSVEADDLRSKLVSETLKFQQANEKLDTERQKVIKEKRRADLEMAKVEEQRKLSEINRRKVVEEKSRADCLSQQLEEGIRRLEKLQDIAKHLSSTKLVEAPGNLSIKQMNLETAKLKGRPQLEMTKIEAGAPKLVLDCFKCEELNKKLKDVKQKANREKKRADSEMRKAEEQKKVLEAYEQKAIVEKNRAEQLAQELEDNRRKTGELKEELQELVSSRTLVDPLVSKYMNTEATRRKLLRKELKLEKMQVKHAKQVASLEKGRNVLLQREILRLKEEFSQISNHLDTLDKCFSYGDVGIDDLEKNCCVSKSPSLNLKRKFLAEEPYEMHLQSGNELLNPSYTALDDSDPFKHSVKCNAPLLPISRRNCTESISGIDSKLEPLLRGSNRTMLKSSSAINSSMASFSDRPLVGSQERGALSVVELDKLVEGKTNSQPTISRLSDDVTKSMYDKNIAVVAENSVRSPLRIDAVGQKAGHNKKRKRVGDAVESIEHLYCESKKWHLQIAEKLSILQDMLESRTDKCLGEGRCLVPDLQDNDHKKKNAVSEEELATQQLHISNELKSKLGINGFGETYIYPNDSRPANNATGIAHACNEKIGDASKKNSRIFEEVADKYYMKFLELDNPFDEESYRVAIERPLSPTLPEIGFQIDNSKSFVVGCFNGVLSVENDNMVPSCSLDVEIDYSKLNVNTSRTCHEKESVDDFCEILENDEKCKSQTMHAGNSSMNQLWNLSELGLLDTGNKGINISLESNPGSARDDFPRFCVVFSDTNDNNSISKIFSATRTCLTRCSMISQTDRVVQKTLSALLKVEDLLPKEKVCVFFSVLLQNFPGIALENFKNLREGGLIPFFDSFAGHMHSVMQNLETRRMFEELLNLDELLNLIEDFLIDRRVLVHGDVSSDSLLVIESRASIVLSGGNVILSFQVASAQQLVAAAIVLASICAAVDHIGFVCEASYNIFKMQKIDSSMLAILHVFAYICGAKYFTNNDYSLLVTVIKSLVTFLERAKMSTGSTLYCQSLIKVQLGFPPCNECPFSEGVVSMDVVVSLLMEKLDKYALSNVTYEDLIELIVFLNSKALDSKEKTKPCSGDGEVLCVQCRNYDASLCLHKSGMATSLETDSDKTLSNLGDVLSLFELVASNMSWNWTFNNVVFQLLKKLDSCVLKKSLPAIVILLGQLGRLGVDANGYDDTSVENLRGRLSAFLCQSASSNMALPIQIATVTALLGVISLSFEELIKSSTELPEVASYSSPDDCVRKWFSLLSNEQQSLSMRLLIAGVPSCGTG